MTGEQLKEFTESILDGLTLDEDLFYNLLNIAKNKREEKRPWQMLRKLDSTKTASSGNNYSTSKAMPTDERYEYKLMLGTSIELFPVNFEEQIMHRNSANRYYNDRANEVYYILGNVGQAATLHRFYIRTTPDIAAATSPVWPIRFHPLLAFEVAGYYQNGVDADDIFARMSPENKLAARELEIAMTTWDTNLTLRAQNDRVGVANSEPEVDLSQM